jgi:DNA replication protein DnaC
MDIPFELTEEQIQWKVWRCLADQPRPSEGEICPYCGGLGALTLDVPIHHPAFGKAWHCVCRRAAIENKRLREMLHDANIPEEYLGYSCESFSRLAGDDEDKALALEYCRQFAVHDRIPHHETGIVKPGLFLYGDFGVGKTGLAAAVMNERLLRGGSVVWLGFIQFIGDVQDTYSSQRSGSKYISRKDVIQAAAKASFLLIDDMGDRDATRPLSDDQRHITFELLEARRVNRRPTLITSNLLPAEFMTQFKGRIAQRVFEMCHTVRVGGRVLRK